MTNDGSTTSPAGAPTGAGERDSAPKAPRLKTGAAAAILDMDPRTVERWIDSGKLRGGRPRDPITGRPIKGSHRWADAEHVVQIAAGNGLVDRVPAELTSFIPVPRQGDTVSGQNGS